MKYRLPIVFVLSILFCCNGCNFNIFQPNEVKYSGGKCNFKLIIEADKNSRDWLFSKISSSGVLPFDFKNNESLQINFLCFHNEKMTIEGKIDRPGLFSLRKLDNTSEIMFMIDYGAQVIRIKTDSIMSIRDLFDYCIFR